MSKYVFGIDVGGTTVKLGLFNVEGEVLDKWEIKTRTEDNGKNIVPDIATSIKDKLSEKNIDASEVVGAGIGVPGPVDSEGVVRKAVNLGWGITKVEDELSALLNMPVKAGNDANVAALGEMWKGAGAGFKSIVMVTLGTGIGGGIIINEKIVTGSTGAAGEIGHIHVQDGEPEACGCGNHGCIEQYASATGIVRLANRKLASCDTDSVIRNGEVSAKTVFDGVKAGDALCIEIAEQFGEYLGNALAAIACVVNPDAIVIGGGVSRAGQVVIDYTEKYYKENVFHASRDVKFVLATLGNDAGIFGSAKLLID